MTNNDGRVCSPLYVAPAASKSVNKEPTVAADVSRRHKMVKKADNEMSNNDFFLKINMVVNSEVSASKLPDSKLPDSTPRSNTRQHNLVVNSYQPERSVNQNPGKKP